MPFVTRLPALTGADPYPDALMALDFVGARRGPQYYKSGGVTTADITKIPGWTYTGGASTGSYAPKADGTLQLFAQNAPRITDAGYLAEESRTNSIPQNGTAGAVVGVVGSGGAVPNGWALESVTGISYEIVSIGSGAYGPYADVRIYGTNTSGGTAYPGIYFSGGTTIVAATGQTWASSVYTALVAGSLSGVTTPILNVRENTAAGGYVANGVSNFTLTSDTTRQTLVRTFSGGATVARTSLAFMAQTANGASINFTVRLSLPQQEQGSFATSPIPTTSVAVTRAADVGYISGLTVPSALTLRVDFSRTAAAATGFSGAASINSGSAANETYITRNSSTSARAYVTAASSPQEVLSATLSSGVDAVSAAIRSAALDGNGAANGTLAAGSGIASVVVPTGLTTLSVGTRAAGATPNNGPIRRIVIYPRAMSNSELQAITTAGAY